MNAAFRTEGALKDEVALAVLLRLASVNVRDICASSSGVIDGFQISCAIGLVFMLGLRRMLSLRVGSGGSVSVRAMRGMDSSSSYEGEGLERSEKDFSVSRMEGAFHEPMEVMDPARALRVFRKEGISSREASSSSCSRCVG